MARIKTFPQQIFVTVEEDADDDWLLAEQTKEAALSDNGKIIVGTYQFVAAEEVSDGKIVSVRRKTRKTS